MAAGTTLIDQLARRVRDTTNFAHARTFLLETLNRCNRALQAALQAETATTTLTVVPGRTLYRIPTDFGASDIIRVIGVRDAAGRELQDIEFERLVEEDPDWLHRTDVRPEVFSRIGRDLLAVYPAVETPKLGEALTAVYVQRPADFLDDSGLTPAIPDERAMILLDLAEVVVYLRGRIFTPPTAIGDPLKRLSAALGIEIAYGSGKHGQVVP